MPRKRAAVSGRGDREFKYDINAIVFAFHGPLLYKAKILKREFDNRTTNEEMYYIHYHGWNRSWDEWVETRRLLPVDSKTDTLKKQLEDSLKEQELHAADLHDNSSTSGDDRAADDEDNADDDDVDDDGDVHMKVGTGSTQTGRHKAALVARTTGNKREKRSTPFVPSPGVPARKRRRSDPAPESGAPAMWQGDACQTYHKRQKCQDGTAETEARNCKVALPIRVRESIAQQYLAISSWKSLLVLPRPGELTVMSVCRDFVNKRRPDERPQYEEIVHGLTTYFDYLVFSKLLFEAEVLQAKRLQEEHKGKRPADLFGVEHFARMFVKLPSLLAVEGFTPTHRQIFRQRASVLLKHLNSNFRKLFACEDDYTPITDEYRQASEKVELEDLRTYKI